MSGEEIKCPAGQHGAVCNGKTKHALNLAESMYPVSAYDTYKYLQWGAIAHAQEQELRLLCFAGGLCHCVATGTGRYN